MIQAAGGLLWKKGAGTSMRIALVHRRQYGDWTLPKGKLEAGESPLQAALREVREETGYRAIALGFAGAITYETASGSKRVRFWNMTPATGVREPLDENEIDETVWLDPAEACLKLDYPLEQAVVEAHMGYSLSDDESKQISNRPGLRQRLWAWWSLKDIAYENLVLRLPLLTKEFAGLRDELKTADLTGAKASVAWAQRVQALLDSAEGNRTSDPELAWRFAKAAERAMLFGEDALHPGEADARAHSLLKEAKEKIAGWRGEAIRNLLEHPVGPLPPVWKVVRAARIADEHHDNAFRRLKILRKRLRLFGAASLMITAGYIALAPRAEMLSNITPDGAGAALSVLAVAFMGLTGAVISVLISTKSISNDRVPVQQAQTAVLLGRLALGPISALAVATLLASEIVKGQAPDYNTTLAAAFVSGFSERLVLESIATFSRRSE